MTTEIYYSVEIIRSQQATERENLEYPAYEKTVCKTDNLELAEFEFEHTYIGAETAKELRQIEEKDGVIVKDTLIKSTF